MKQLIPIQKFENLNDVYALDDPGPGGAHHLYEVVKHNTGRSSEEDGTFRTRPENTLLTVQMQEGPRKDPDAVHGVLDTDLLEIVRDRLAAFQSGPFACRENALALTHIEEALLWMNKRTEDRMIRRVLGTYEK